MEIEIEIMENRNSVEAQERAIISSWETRKGFVEEVICEDSDLQRLTERISHKENHKQWPGGWKSHLDGASGSICEPGQL